MGDDLTGSYPLEWPPGRPRRPAHERQDARFTTSMESAQQGLLAELRLHGARNAVLSTDMALRQRDGLPYAKQTKGMDPGAAVYFERDGQQLAFCCDRWRDLRDNVQAIRKTIEAIRGIVRWGSGDMVAAAFSGFVALPPPSAGVARPWWKVLNCTRDLNIVEIGNAYRARAQKVHPDAPDGSHDAMAELNAAYDQAKAERRIS